MNILCVYLHVLVCVKLKNYKVSDNRVRYIKSLAVHKVVVDVLPEATPSLGLWMQQGKVNHTKPSGHYLT